MIEQDIRAALVSQLLTITDLPDIVYENTDYTPTAGLSYIEEKTEFDSEIGLTRGDGRLLIVGYTLLVHTPTNESVGVKYTIFDKLRSGFKRGMRLTYNATSVEVHGVNLKDFGDKDGFNTTAFFITNRIYSIE